MKGGIDQGRCVSYWKLSYRRKFIRTIWIFAIGLAVMLILQIHWIVIVIFSIGDFVQAGYNYYRWQMEKRYPDQHVSSAGATNIRPDDLTTFLKSLDRKTIWIRVVATIVAFLAGALAWVVPPHALGRIVERYQQTAWAWLGDGLWNAVPTVSVPATMIIGFVYGLLIPKCWYISFLATWWVVVLNLVLDVAHAPTSHNLWPLELVAFAVWNLPTIAAAWLGKHVSRRRLRAQPHVT